ncbi:MAG: discoidin domain-containing protein, partial [Cetobacterium sp.]
MKTTSNNKEILFFTIETNVKNVINKLEIVTSTNISNAEIQYIDEHGYDKTSKLLSVKTIENKLELSFESFYSNKFELAIFDSVADGEIESINIVSINQYDFYEDKDIDVRLDKSKMTAISLCGQHANNSPDLAIDGNVGTTFHSAGYGSYGEFVLQLGAEYLVGGLGFITRADNAGTGNGRIRAYDVMYKSNSDEEWKKVFNQPTEEAGENRVATFKPVLASEICIRVTNGKNKYVVINEID